MYEAIFGLVGTVVGGVITYLSARHAGDQQLKQRKLELEHEARIAKEDAMREWKKSQLARYGEFISAFRQEEGRIVEMRQVLVGDAPDWIKQYDSKINHPSHEAGITQLNSGLAWIELTCDEPSGIASVRELSEDFESLARCMADEARNKSNGGKVNVEAIEQELQNLRSHFEAVCFTLRKETFH
jgi:hypothetical protein